MKRLVASFQGFVFVTPQYNWGYPAALKNTWDYLYKEWNGGQPLWSPMAAMEAESVHNSFSRCSQGSR